MLDNELIVLDNINLDNTKIIYLSDDLKTVEYYDVEIVVIDKKNYLKFSKKHFSNYIIASGDVMNNPDTFDGIMNWLILEIIAIFGIFGILFYKRKLAHKLIFFLLCLIYNNS